MRQGIEGTTLFDGVQAQRGYALNKMCFSFNEPDNRAAFLRDEDGLLREIRPDAGAARGGRSIATCSR